MPDAGKSSRGEPAGDRTTGGQPAGRDTRWCDGALDRETRRRKPVRGCTAQANRRIRRVGACWPYIQERTQASCRDVAVECVHLLDHCHHHRRSTPRELGLLAAAPDRERHTDGRVLSILASAAIWLLPVLPSVPAATVE